MALTKYPLMNYKENLKDILIGILISITVGMLRFSIGDTLTMIAIAISAFIYLTHEYCPLIKLLLKLIKIRLTTSK